MATGRTAATTRTRPARSAFFLLPPADEGGVHGSMSAPHDLRHRRQREARGLRRVLPQLGGDRSDRSPDRRDRRRLEPGRSVGPADPGAKHLNIASGRRASAANAGIVTK